MSTYLFPFFHRSFSTGTRTVPRSRVAAGGSRRTGARRLRPDSDGSHSAKAGGRVAQGRGHVQKGSYTQATSTTIYNIIILFIVFRFPEEFVRRTRHLPAMGSIRGKMLKCFKSTPSSEI